ncbi:transposase [Methylocaldum sp.]|uniref:transposase n=1 Tax=Methylocaldum sp. TaxID=1969727 RepID=UPI002D3E3F5D|nr:transposase [Methylocaldum sp.]HYE35627.1 transposase [Methylocaldum sp.]
MARKPRIHIPGAVYHVMLRGNGGQTIFLHNDDRDAFEELVAEGVSRYDHRIHGYCWMPNHIHLAVQVGDVPLSKAMQHLAFRYTRWINKRENRIGHLFQGRFKAILVDADTYLLELVRYIHLNPVRTRLVSDPTEYRWSGHRAYLGLDRVSWLTTNWVYSQLAQDMTTAREQYARFVAAGLQEDYREDFHRGTSEGRILGDDHFVENALKQASQSSGARIKLESIISVVCAARRMDLDQVSGADRGRAGAEARALIAYLALDMDAATLTQTGKFFNRDISTLSSAVSRLRERMKLDSDLAGEIKRLANLLGINANNKA